MKKTVIFALMLSACGDYNPCPAEHPDFVAGMCIDRKAYDIEYDKVEEVVAITEKYYNRYYPDQSLDLPSFLEEEHLKVVYYDHIRSAPGTFTRGLTITHGVDGEPLECPLIVGLGFGCDNIYYVLGHEIMHVIAALHLEVTPEINAAHLIEHFYLNWTTANDLHPSEAIEWQLFNEVGEEICLTQD